MKYNRCLWAVLAACWLFVASGQPLAWSQQQPLLYSEAPEVVLARLIQANAVPQYVVSGIRIDASDTINAYTDGQQIVVHQGLWRQLSTSDQRAFVIGHELSHILLRHIEKTRGRQMGLQILDRIITTRFSNPLAGKVADAGVFLIDRKFSRNVEYQADELGLKLMRQARYNPQAAVEVLQLLGKLNQNGGVEFLQSHPLSESRVRALLRQSGSV